MSLRSTIKSWFQTGDVPTQTQFSDTWDSTVIWDDDVETTLGTTDTKVPTSKAVSDAISGIATPTLQEVTTAGNTTTDDIEINALNLYNATDGLYNFKIDGDDTVITFYKSGNQLFQIDDSSINIGNAIKAGISNTLLTASRTYTLPDASGTFALLSDIGSFVPYTGATGDVDLGTYSLNAKSFKVNGTGGSGHLSLKHQSSGATASASESAIYADNSGNPQWKNDSLAVDGMFTSRLFGAIVDAFTNKSTPVDADEFGIADSAASNGSKKVTLVNLWTNYIKVKADAVYQAALGFTPLNPSNNLSDVSNTTTARTNLGFDTLNAVLAETAADGAASSGTANTYSTGVLITPAMINVDTSIEVVYGMRKTGIAGNTTLRIYANTTNDLSGSPILIGQAQYASTILNSAQSRFLKIKVKAGTGAGTEVLATSINSVFTDYSNNATAASNLAIDWTSNKYIVAAVQAGSSSDSIRINFLKVRR